MENKNTLNGFEAIFDSLVSNVGANKTNEDNEKDIVDGVSEELTDEELEALRNPKKNKKNEKEEIEEDNEEDLDDEEEEEEPAKPDTKKGKKKSESKDDKEDTKEEEYEDNDDSNDDKSEEVIVGFFDSLSEQLGWDDINDDEKPRTAEELIEYFKDVIEENSTPSYSSEEVEKLDEFVRNGGNLKDYFSIDADIDLDNIEVEDNEINQKLIVKEFLKEKGFSTKQIEKKITKYEDAGILEDEATDALEALKDIKAERKEKLLEQQQK
nr:MAG TPA: protein of unknown function (DUF4350) [Caudoviricetes sp.]